MSTTTATIRIAAPERAEEPRRRFEVVTGARSRRARPKVVHAIVAVLGVLMIVAAQLGISIAVSAGAYRIGDLQSEARALTRTKLSLGEQLQVEASTQHLAENAAALGMVPAGSVSYLDPMTGATSAAPGFPDPVGCGGLCHFAPNVLADRLELVLPPGKQLVTGTTAAELLGNPGAAAPADAPRESGQLPAPVTH